MKHQLRLIDAFCARLNPGLAAVMLVLSILLAAEISAKLGPFLEDAMATSAAIGPQPVAP